MVYPARWLLIANCVLSASPVVLGGEPQPTPEDFPRFIVPGHEQAMASLRDLYWLHYRDYRTRSKPMPTVWDEWMTGSTLWPAVESTGGMSEIRRHWAQGLGSRVIDTAKPVPGSSWGR